MLQIRRSLARSQLVSLDFSLTQNPFDRSMVLESTQPLTDMSTKNISGGKSNRRVRLTTLPPSCALVTKSGNLNFLEPSSPLKTCIGTDLPFYLLLSIQFPSSSSCYSLRQTFSQRCSQTTSVCVFPERERPDLPILVTGLCNAWICGRLLGGTAGSNPAGSMDVCVL